MLIKCSWNWHQGIILLTYWRKAHCTGTCILKQSRSPTNLCPTSPLHTARSPIQLFCLMLCARGGYCFWVLVPHKRQVTYPRARTCPVSWFKGWFTIKQIFSGCSTCFQKQNSYLENFKRSSWVTLRFLAGCMWPAGRTFSRPALRRAHY